MEGNEGGFGGKGQIQCAATCCLFLIPCFPMKP